MKHLILLRGVDGTGKTTKINTIAHWIITTYGVPNTIGLDPLNYEKNTFGILTVGTFRIGINSAGDNEPEVKKNDSIKGSVDILLCASRTKGRPYHYFDSYSWPNWFRNVLPVAWHAPTDVAGQATRDANLIVAIRLLLRGI